ncbi:hypothetical protein EV121DRAFT_213850 [Schizophyllum commune]
MWYTLIPWLDRLLENRDKRPLDSIQDIIRSQLIPFLFCHKRALRALLLETPQLYRIFFDTWLHFDTYYPDPAALPDRRAAFGQVLRIIYQHALWSDGDVGDCEGGKASDADPFALDCLLSVVKRRPRRLYRHAVRQASRFARPGDALETLQMDLKLICELAGTLIPIPNHARDVILAVVDILRELDTLGTREAAAAAADGCFLLLKMWSSERSHERGRRTMTWALRAGALPLMRGIYSREPDRVIAHALESIASHAIYVDVLRAVVVGAKSNNSQGSPVLGFADEATEKCISARLALLTRFGRRCPSTVGHPPLRRCVCFDALYCSKECQKRDWQGHRRSCSGAAEMQCGAVAHPHPPEPRGAAKSRDAHFFILCARAYVKDHAQDVLNDIRHVEGAEMQPAPVFDVVVAFETPSLTHHVRLMEATDAYDAPIIHVTAAVRPAPDEHMAVEVMTVPLSALEWVAEGYDEDFDRFWM